jgi:nitrous oxidase accessory protein NosD
VKILAIMLALCAFPAQAARLHATPETFAAKLAQAHGGDTLLLEPGTYAGWAPKGLSFSPGLTITSADAAHPATLTNLEAHNLKGVTFSKLEMLARAPGYFVFQFFDCNDLHFDRVDVHGSLNGDPHDDAEGISIAGSTDVSITNSEFHELKRAMAISTSTGVKVSDNRAHDLQVTGFMFAADSQVGITGNAIWNIMPVTGDHADAIQFLTAGTTTASSDIAISRNLIYRGKGGAAQGIFLRDQVGTLPYQGVIIAENLIVGTGYNGILVMGAKTLAVTDNELVSNPGSTNDTWILVQAADGVTLNHNRAEKISVDTSTNVTQKANKLTEPVGDGGVGALRAWASSHPDKAHDVALLIPND